MARDGLWVRLGATMDWARGRAVARARNDYGWNQEPLWMG